MEIIDFRCENDRLVITLNEEVDFGIILANLNEKITTLIQQNPDKLFTMYIDFQKRKVETSQLLCFFDLLQNDEKILISGINFYNEEKIDIEIYEGSIRAGQIVYFENSAMILGDINPGGMVIARLNVYVVGKVYGRVVSKSRSGNISAVAFIDSLIQIFDSQGTLMNLNNSSTIYYENHYLTVNSNKGGEKRYVKSGSSYVR